MRDRDVKQADRQHSSHTTITKSFEERLFDNAEAFRRSADVIYERSDDAPLIHGIPAYALYAFSLELYLKCVIAIEKNKPARGHKLYELYKQIGFENQNRLKELYKLAVAPGLYKHQLFYYALKQEGIDGVADPTDLEAVLKVSTDAFTALRYFHEHESKKGAAFQAGAVPRAIRNLIFELRPNFLNPQDVR